MRTLATLVAAAVLLACPSARTDNGRPDLPGQLRAEGGGATGAFPGTTAIDFLAWNINAGDGSNDGQLPFIEEVLGRASSYEVITLSEVEPGWLDFVAASANASGRSYAAIRGEAGCRMRLMTLIAEDRFEVVGRGEVTSVPSSRCARAPLWVTLRDLETGERFEVVGIHLLRGRGSEGRQRRAAEAAALRNALSRDDLPVVVLGDANMDCPQATAPTGCAEAFEALTGDGFLTWIEPSPREETTCRTDLDDMLDLVFAGRGAERWSWQVEVLHEPRFCAPNMARGAHYPIRASATR